MRVRRHCQRVLDGTPDRQLAMLTAALGVLLWAALFGVGALLAGWLG